MRLPLGRWHFRLAAKQAFAALALVILASVECAAVVAQDATQPPPPAAAGSSGDEPRRVVIRFLTEGDFPPFNYYDDDGVLAGFNVDLARAICLELGVACDIKVRPWEELLLALRRGDADAVIAGHKVTAAALTDVDFSERYFYTPGRFAGRVGGAALDVSPEGLDGVLIGVTKGSAHEAYLRTFFRDSRIVVFENQELLREALQQEKVQVIFDDGISLAFWLNGSLARQCCEFKGGPYLEPKFFGDGIAVAVPRNDPQIKMLINQAIDKVRESGRFQELVERYFPIRVY